MKNLFTRINRKFTNLLFLISILLSSIRSKSHSEQKDVQERGKIDGEKQSKAIIVKLDGIGDFIMVYSAFLELRKHYKKLLLVCNVQDYGIAQTLARNYGLFDEILPINTKQYPIDRSYRREVNKDLKALHGDILLTMAYCRPIDMEYIVSKILAKKKITLSRDTHSRKLHLCDRLYDEIVDEAINEFEICKDFHLISAVISSNVNLSSTKISANKSANTSAIAPYLAIMPQMSDIDVAALDLGENYVVISSGGSYNAKKWPASRYSAVANYILSLSTEYRVVLMGGPGDKQENKQIYDGIEEQYRADGRVKDLTGKYNLCDCIEIIRKSKLVISNDTCYIHMAVMTGTKSVAIAGGWHWGRFLPYYLGLLATTATRANTATTAAIATTAITTVPSDTTDTTVGATTTTVGTVKKWSDGKDWPDGMPWLPQAILHRMACFNCNGTDKKCIKLSKAGEMYPCIDKVTTEAVIDAVSEIIERENNEYRIFNNKAI